MTKNSWKNSWRNVVSRSINKFLRMEPLWCENHSRSKWRIQFRSSILLHSGLNPAWHFWLSTRFSCCLKMKSVENILGYIREQFYSCKTNGCKPQENLWNCSRKYTKMFKTDSFFRQQKIEFNLELFHFLPLWKKVLFVSS